MSLLGWNAPYNVNSFRVFVSMLISSFFYPYRSDVMAHIFTAWILFHRVNFEHNTYLSLRNYHLFNCSFNFNLHDFIESLYAKVLIVFLFNWFRYFPTWYFYSCQELCFVSFHVRYTTLRNFEFYLNINTKTMGNVYLDTNLHHIFAIRY